MQVFKKLLGMIVVTFAMVSVSQAQSFLTNGLVAYYPFNGNANDASGNGNTATFVSGVYNAINRFGMTNSAAYVSTNGSIHLPSATGFQGNSISFAFWYQTETNILNDQANNFFCQFLSAGADHIPLMFVNSPVYGANAMNLGYYWGNSIGGFQNENYTLSTTSWSHFCLIINGSSQSVFVNGVQVYSANNYFGNSSFPVTDIGNFTGDPSTHSARGAFSDFRIYNRALSSNEVAQLYAFESQPPINITTQPYSTTNNIGDTINFTVGISNANPVTYQWFKDGITIPHDTNATLTITNVQSVNIGDYSVTITDTYGNSVTSSNAMLRLNGVNSGIWQGLVAYYPFDGNANDTTGNGNNGAVDGAILAVDRLGIPNAAYNFIAGSSISFTNPPAINPFGSFTYSFWINASSQGSYPGVWCIDRTTPSNPLVSFAFATDNSLPNTVLEFAPRYDDGSDINGTLGTPDVAGGTLTPGMWQHVIMVREFGSEFKLYLNGQLVASAADIGKSLTPPTIKIGQHESGSSQYLGGFDDFRIYNRALSSNDVAALYASESIIITNQPVSSTNNIGDIVNFTVDVNTVNPVTFQWVKDGITLSGQTNPIITITNAQPVNVGAYSVVISDAFGNSVTSSNAMLTLNGVNSGVWQGLVAYYPFNGNVNDASGNGNNGTGNLVTLTADRFGLSGNAFHFTNDVNSEIAIPDSSSLNLGTNFSISLWFKYDQSWTYHDESLIYQYQTPQNIGWYMGINQDNSEYGVGNFDFHFQVNTAYVLNSPFAYSKITNWRHLVGVCNGTTLSLYLDGVLAGQSLASSISHSSVNLIIGGSQNPVSGAYNRDIDDVRIYNRALSSNDVSALYTSESIIITNQPVSSTNNIGDTVNFTVGASTVNPVSFQWIKDGITLNGQTNATIAITNVRPGIQRGDQ